MREVEFNGIGLEIAKGTPVNYHDFHIDSLMTTSGEKPYEHTFTVPGKLKGVLTFEAWQEDEIRALPTRATITMQLVPDIEHDYIIYRRDYKRRKLWLEPKK